MPLYVTVTPAVTLDENTVIDASVANRIASPTVDISGTVDGESAVTISAGSVGNDKLAPMTGPSVKGKMTGSGDPEDVTIDNSTVEIYDNSGTTTMRIKSSGVTATQLGSASVTTAKVAIGNVTPNTIEGQKPTTVLANPASTITSGPVPVTIGNGLAVSGVTEVALSNRAKASGTATITTGSAHGFSTGDYVSVTTSGGTGYNVSRVAVTVSSTTVFTYSIQNTDTETTASDTGYCVKVASAAGTNSATLAVTHTSPYVAKVSGLMFGRGEGPVRWATATYSQTGTSVVVTSTSHGLPVGAIVYIDATSGALSDGAYTITAATTDTFTFVTTSATTSGNCTIQAAVYGQNVTRITRTSTGLYGVYFDVSFSNTGYRFVGSGVKNTASTASALKLNGYAPYSGRGITSTLLYFQNTEDGSLTDPYEYQFAIFGS